MGLPFARRSTAASASYLGLITVAHEDLQRFPGMAGSD